MAMRGVDVAEVVQVQQRQAQGLAAAQRFGGFVEHVHAAAVADVVCRAQWAAHRRIVPQALLDHAIGIADEGDQYHHVDQRGVVGDHQLPGAAETFGAFHRIGQHAAVVHEFDEQQKGLYYHQAGAGAVRQGIAGQQTEQRKDQYAQQYAAYAKQGETQRRGDQAPAVGRAVAAQALMRDQFH